MNRVGWLLALAGAVLAAALFARTNIAEIIDLVASAGFGLVVAGGFHVVPMAVNGIAWRRLLPPSDPLRLRAVTRAIWIRESVNALLPVARIGGEVVAYRMIRREGVSRPDGAASLVVDMALSVLSQIVFCLFGLGVLLVSNRDSSAAKSLMIATMGMVPLAIAFVWFQRSALLTAAIRLLDRAFLGHLRAALHGSMRVDEATRAVYARKRDISACFAWQLVGWLVASGEVWLALYFLGRPTSAMNAIVIEAFVQAASSAAFFMPAALGVQEGAFVLIGAALGLDATTALALATARRLRDVIVFSPGLAAWQMAERRGAALDASAQNSP